MMVGRCRQSTPWPEFDSLVFFYLKYDLSRYAKSQEISKINWGAFNFKNNNKNWYVGKKINHSNKGFSDNYKLHGHGVLCQHRPAVVLPSLDCAASSDYKFLISFDDSKI